jgi:hypothetical protein
LDVGARLGDRFEASTEWIDDGCELAREDGALEVEVLVILREKWKRALKKWYSKRRRTRHESVRHEVLRAAGCRTAWPDDETLGT